MQNSPEIKEKTEEQVFEFGLSQRELQEILLLLKEKDAQNPTAQKLIDKFNSQSPKKIENKPMSYSQFTLKEVMEAFQLKGTPESFPVLFPNITAIEPSEHLKNVLQQNKIIPAKSEKARSETIITPILVEIAQRSNGKFTVLSGERMDVDSSRGLAGECDYIFNTFSVRQVLTEPVFALVEAKKGDIDEGLGQCLAQMIGAKELNQAKDKPIPAIYGCVTNGEIWQFLKLEQDTITIDYDRYYLSEINKLLGIFQYIIDEFLANQAQNLEKQV